MDVASASAGRPIGVDRFAAYVESSPDAILIADRALRIVAANAAASGLFRCDRASLIGRPLTAWIAASGAGGEPSPPFEISSGRFDGVEGIRADGSRFPAGLSVVRLPGDDAVWCVTVRDSTARADRERQLRAALAAAEERAERERRKAREAWSRLEETVAKFRLAGDTIRDVFWICDPGVSRALYVNGTYEALFGRPVAELYEDAGAFFRAIHRKDRERVLGAVLDLRRGRSVDVEYRVVAADGAVRWLRTYALPVRGADGEIDSVIGVAENVTERRERDEALEFLGEASRTLGESLDYEDTLRRIARLAVPRLADWCAVDICDAEIARRATDPADIQGQAAVAGVAAGTEEPAGPVTELAARVMRTGVPLLLNDLSREAVQELGAADEQLGLFAAADRPCSAMVVPMTVRGRVLGTITLVSTESGRSYGQKDLDLARELAARAAAALDNALLYEQAVVANRAKSDFLAVVSHELRTPLNAIASYAEVLQLGIDGPITRGQAAQIRGIRANAQQLAEIIDQILTYSSLGREPDEARRQRVSVGALLRRIAAAARPLATAKGLRFHVRPPSPPIAIRTDPAKLSQVLMNLVSNAIKFTEAGEVEIAAVAADRHVTFSVRDTGIGIPADRRDRIFDPFYQAEEPRARRVGGTGLGLSIAHRLVHLLGGTISVQSTEGVGTTVMVRIPRDSDRQGLGSA